MTTYMLMYSIPEKAGGITSVMLNRSKLLAEKGYSCALLTLDDKNYDPLRAKLTNSGRLHKEVKKDNINELAKKIIHVLKKETLISQFSENARTTIKTNFSYEAVSKKWIELIDEKSK
ncbi:TPA: hypothetical protein PIX39_001483 [Staphylococcus aureus]|nr:hypothetical protein [Staphylococcus aureus]HDH4420603.1 hypothetical protein [Staphylococcus aureus]HDH4671428.1 hypothetical protein [Staphylococcus aureus]HDH4722958.1 hypothetical protein [Staphylococcus aureus]HDH4798561.1 hypothetical protein [Staphylococcus aureus]